MAFIEDEILICLNFDDQIDQSFFKKTKIFFNAANLDSQRPLIQIDKHVFQGSYEDCLGTNIFLEEIAEPRSVDKVFQIPTPMHLEYLKSSSKILNLKCINVPEEVKTITDSECVDVRFLEDYQTVLDKIDRGTLNIQDAINRMESEKRTNNAENIATEESMHQDFVHPIAKEFLTKVKSKEPITSQDLLKRIVEPISVDDSEHCDILHDKLFRSEKCNSFPILKQLYINHLNKEVGVMKQVSLNLANIFSLVNVQKSIEDGIIIKPPINGEISDEDKQALFSMRNFDNLSLPVQFIVLSEYLGEYKKYLQKLSMEEINVVDEFTRTPKQRYKLLKSLARDIEYILLRQCTAATNEK